MQFGNMPDVLQGFLFIWQSMIIYVLGYLINAAFIPLLAVMKKNSSPLLTMNTLKSCSYFIQKQHI